MKSNSNIALLNKDEAHILHSLRYLTHEAKGSGSEQLYSILETALNLAQTNNKLANSLLSKSANDEEIKKAGYFLFQFISASDEVKNNVLTLILNEESLIQSLTKRFRPGETAFNPNHQR